jgi:hypothetical protein
MAAWPRRRSSAWPSRSSASRCCLGPGCENLEARRGDRGWPLGQEGDHRLVLPGARLQGAASEPAAKTSKLAAEIADGRLAKRAVIFQEFAFKVLNPIARITSRTTSSLSCHSAFGRCGQSWAIGLRGSWWPRGAWRNSSPASSCWTTAPIARITSRTTSSLSCPSAFGRCGVNNHHGHGQLQLITLAPQSCWRRSSITVWRLRLLPGGG